MVVSVTRGRRVPAIIVVVVASALAAPTASATTRLCGAVLNPYPGTKYEDVDLRRVTATGVSCRTAKRVARGAHRKALRITPDASGFRRLLWDGWSVVGDLRGASDSYVATKRGARVRWRF